MTNGLKPYPSYKPSGLPWLGDMPEHWEVRKLRNVLRGVAERNRPELPLLSVVREKGVILRNVNSREENFNFIPDDLTNYKVVLQGQFAMNKMKAWQGSYGVSPYDGIVSPAYFVFDVAPHELERTYFHSAIRSKVYVSFFAQASDGVRIGQWDLSRARMKEIPFLVPPEAEQTAIVRYLEYMDRRIRRYIRAKTKLIALLNEQKQAIVHQAVTGQIDVRTGKPYPAYKPSGVEWLGDVPEHWEVKRLKTIADIRYGLGQPPRESSTGLPLIRATNVDHGHIVDKDLVLVDPADVPKTRNAFLSEGEIVVVRSGAYTADSAIVPQKYAGAVTGYDMVVTPRKARSEFIALALLSSYVRDDQLIRVSMRSAQPHLNAEELGSALIMVPPDTEQGQVVRHVKRITKRIETHVTSAQHINTLLREYRTRLIADVVTGKLDVREAAANLPDEAEEPEPLDEADADDGGEEEGDKDVADEEDEA